MVVNSIPHFIAPDSIACYINRLTPILYNHTGYRSHLFACFTTTMLPTSPVKLQVFPGKVLKRYNIFKALCGYGIYICGLAKDPFVFINGLLCCFIPMIAVQV